MALVGALVATSLTGSYTSDTSNAGNVYEDVTAVPTADLGAALRAWLFDPKGANLREAMGNLGFTFDDSTQTITEVTETVTFLYTGELHNTGWNGCMNTVYGAYIGQEMSESTAIALTLTALEDCDVGAGPREYCYSTSPTPGGIIQFKWDLGYSGQGCGSGSEKTIGGINVTSVNEELTVTEDVYDDAELGAWAETNLTTAEREEIVYGGTAERRYASLDTDLDSEFDATAAGAEYAVHVVVRTDPFNTNTVSIRALEDAFGRVIGDGVAFSVTFRGRRYNRGNVYIQPGTSNSFLGPFGATGDKLVIQPEGLHHFEYPATGWTVDSSNTNILFTNPTAFVADVDLVLTGTSSNF